MTNAGQRWRAALNDWTASEGNAGVRFARRNAAAETMAQIESAYENGELSSGENLNVWAAMTASRLPPFTESEIRAVAVVVHTIDERLAP